MGVLMAASPLLQMRLIIREGHSEEVSLGFLAIIFLGASAWTAHGVDSGGLVLIIPNSLGMICSMATLICALAFRDRAPLRRRLAQRAAAARTR